MPLGPEFALDREIYEWHGDNAFWYEEKVVDGDPHHINLSLLALAHLATRGFHIIMSDFGDQRYLGSTLFIVEGRRKFQQVSVEASRTTVSVLNNIFEIPKGRILKACTLPDLTVFPPIPTDEFISSLEKTDWSDETGRKLYAQFLDSRIIFYQADANYWSDQGDAAMLQKSREEEQKAMIARYELGEVSLLTEDELTVLLNGVVDEVIEAR